MSRLRHRPAPPDKLRAAAMRDLLDKFVARFGAPDKWGAT